MTYKRWGWVAFVLWTLVGLTVLALPGRAQAQLSNGFYFCDSNISAYGCSGFGQQQSVSAGAAAVSAWYQDTNNTGTYCNTESCTFTANANGATNYWDITAGDGVIRGGARFQCSSGANNGQRYGPNDNLAVVCPAWSPPTVCPSVDTPGDFHGNDVYGTGSSVPATTCQGGCEYTVLGHAVVGTQWYGSVSYSTGAGCTAVDDPPNTCGTGQCNSTFNGSPICVPCQSLPDAVVTDKKDSTTTKSDPANNTTTTSTTSTTTTSNNSTNTVTQVVSKTTTTCVGSPPVCTDVTESSTTDSGQGGFCQQNPDMDLCKDSQWSGTCSSGFVCDGDAVACAAAKAVNELNCTYAPHADATVANMLDSAGLATAEQDWKDAQGEPTDLANALSFNSRTLPSASCPGPYPVSTFLGTVNFDVSFICEVAEIVGLFIWLGALVLSFRIVSGGV